MFLLFSTNDKGKSTAEIKRQENAGWSGAEKRLGESDKNNVDRQSVMSQSIEISSINKQLQNIYFVSDLLLRRIEAIISDK